MPLSYYQNYDRKAPPSDSKQKRWKKDCYLNRVNIVGDYHELGFLLLNEGGNRVGTVSKGEGALGGGVFFASGASFGSGLETSFPVLLGLRSVLVQQTEKLSGWKQKRELQQLSQHFQLQRVES